MAGSLEPEWYVGAVGQNSLILAARYEASIPSKVRTLRSWIRIPLRA